MNTGTKIYRNYFPIKFGWQADIQYGRAYPVFRKLMYPGDVFKIHADLLIRYQPMFTPPMNDCVATVRFGFVPLRLIEPNTELIVTGSKDGKLSTETIPVMDSCFKYLNITGTNNKIILKSFLDYMYQIPEMNGLTSELISKLDEDKASPALYFAKAFYRFWWDYYRDENLFSYSDFDAYFDVEKTRLNTYGVPSVCLKKDRITSATPWQLKAVAAPTIELTGNAVMTPSFEYDKFMKAVASTQNSSTIANGNISDPSAIADSLFTTYLGDASTTQVQNWKTTNEAAFNNFFGDTQNVTIQQLGFNAAQMREMMAQTRIFERLARCGSRYTEYLKANFGIAPSDGTLQRTQYLGGFKTRIVTTEVVQTAGAGETPVGTLRGHGITHGTASIKPFMAKEIGVIIGILDVKPETIYAQGVDRELTVRSRFDFLNPSFQHLSEQEVRNGEVYFGIDTDEQGNLINSKTWGFQPYAQELRTGIKHVCGDMRKSLSAWNQSLIFSSRPSLNNAFISAQSHQASYNRPFVVQDTTACPMLVDFGGIIEAYRPLVKNGTPGLVDHN